MASTTPLSNNCSPVATHRSTPTSTTSTITKMMNHNVVLTHWNTRYRSGFKALFDEEPYLDYVEGGAGDADAEVYETGTGLCELVGLWGGENGGKGGRYMLMAKVAT